MIRVNIEGEHYIVVMPKMTLMMKAEFITALRRGKWWKRRKVQTSREAAAMIAGEKRVCR